MLTVDWPGSSGCQRCNVARFILADGEGRERLLSGINLATLGGGGSDVPIDPDLCEECSPLNGLYIGVLFGATSATPRPGG